MKSPCFFVEIFAEKRREVCLMRGQDTVSVLKGEKAPDSFAPVAESTGTDV